MSSFINRLAIIGVVALCLTTQVLASFDPYNSYQWNRKNYQAGNRKVDKKDWYEWWYYKVVDPKTKEAFYFVYGIVNPWDRNGTRHASRAWTSFGSFSRGKIIEEPFPTPKFYAAYEYPYVRVGDNIATDERLSGSLTNDGIRVSWDLEMKTGWTFNAMGWALFTRDLFNIYWYPAQANATMSGWIDYDGKRYELENAPAYQDRNWGRSFPKWWAWIVSNNFKGSPGTVLASGGGLPKIFGKLELLDGMSVGLRHNGRTYTFRPNEGDRVSLNINFGTWEVSATNRRGEKIEISAYAPREKFMRLPFLTPTGKVYNDYETLGGHVRVKLFAPAPGSNKRMAEIANLESDETGIEYGSFDRFDLDVGFKSLLQLQ